MTNNLPLLSTASARRPSREISKLQNRHQYRPEESSSSSSSSTVQLFDPVLRLANFSFPKRVINSAVLFRREYAARQFLNLYSFPLKVIMCSMGDAMFLMITGLAFSASAITSNHEESKELRGISYEHHGKYYARDVTP